MHGNTHLRLNGKTVGRFLTEEELHQQSVLGNLHHIDFGTEPSAIMYAEVGARVVFYALRQLAPRSLRG